MLNAVKDWNDARIDNEAFLKIIQQTTTPTNSHILINALYRQAYSNRELLAVYRLKYMKYAPRKDTIKTFISELDKMLALVDGKKTNDPETDLDIQALCKSIRELKDLFTTEKENDESWANRWAERIDYAFKEAKINGEASDSG